MRPRLSHPLSIRSRLLLYCVCTVVFTAVAISGVTALLESRDARTRVVGQLKSVATLKEQQVNSWIGGLGLNLDIVLSGEAIRSDLHRITVASSRSPSHATARRDVLRRFTWGAKRMGLFEELFFMGPSGQVLVSTDRGHEGQQLGLNDYFIQGMRGQYVQEPSYSLALAEMTVVASCPVTYRGATLGVLAGRANLDGLNQMMVGRTGLGETGETYLVASNHRLLTDLRRPGYHVPDTYVRTAGADAAVDGNQGDATYRGYAGDRVIGVYDWLPKLKVALLAEQGEGEALHATRLALWTTGGVALVATVLAILAGTLLIHSIVRPLSELGETAGRIAGGELDLAAKVTREDEIGKLAHAFNRMTGQLRGLVRSLEKRTDHLRAINDAGRRISSILDLDELLPYVASSLRETFDYDSVNILLLADGQTARLLSCDRDSPAVKASDVRLDRLSSLPAVLSVVVSGEPLLRGRSGTDGGEGAAEPSEIAVPIRVGEKLAGVLEISSGSTHPLDEEDLFAARTLADQLAIAVENTRLYQNAHELAASEERQRLARDLHDAVSQTLFSVSLIAEVLPRVYERDPEQGRERLEELRQLTRGALAEMRMLLLELRPTALAETSLPDLLRQLGEAVVGRARIPVDVRLETDDAIPPEVGIAMYRIAQEALNNVAKHSGATHAQVTLCETADEPGGLELTIRDDGCGFDTGGMGSGRLGLAIMAERAEAIGARLRVESVPGEGTRVGVVWLPGQTPRSRMPRADGSIALPPRSG